MLRRCGTVLAVAVVAVVAVRAETLPVSLHAYDTPAADALVSQVVGPVAEDAALTEVGAGICAYASRPDDLTFTFQRLDVDRPLALALPNGSIYVSKPVLEALGSDPERLAFVCAGEAALVLDGRTRSDEQVVRLLAERPTGQPLPAELIAAVEATYQGDRVLAADREAMLWMARAGLPPMEAVRALDQLSRLGRRHLGFSTDEDAQPSLLDRKVKASLAAADLIQAATEFDFGVMDLVERKWDSAVRRFDAFLALFPDNYAGWNNLGIAHYHLATKDLGPRPYLLADAIAQFDTAFMTRRIHQIHQEEWDQAQAAYRTALDLDPSRPEAPTNLGSLYDVVREYEKARHYLDLALSGRPNFAPALNNVGVVLAEQSGGQIPAACLAQFAAAAAADPNLPEAQFNLGLARLDLNAGGHEEPLRRYLALAPHGPKAREALASLNHGTTGGGDRGGRGGGRGGATQPAPAQGGTTAEGELELYNRVHLALQSRERDMLAMLSGEPDQKRKAPGDDIELFGWTAQGLVVELVSRRVNRVMAGRPPGHEAQTGKGVRVGFTTADVRGRYGDPPAVSRQSPYDIWLYPHTGLGFFVIGTHVDKIFLFSAVQ